MAEGVDPNDIPLHMRPTSAADELAVVCAVPPGVRAGDLILVEVTNHGAAIRIIVPPQCRNAGDEFTVRISRAFATLLADSTAHTSGKVSVSRRMRVAAGVGAGSGGPVAAAAQPTLALPPSPALSPRVPPVPSPAGSPAAAPRQRRPTHTPSGFLLPPPGAPVSPTCHGSSALSPAPSTAAPLPPVPAAPKPMEL